MHDFSINLDFDDPRFVSLLENLDITIKEENKEENNEEENKEEINRNSRHKYREKSIEYTKKSENCFTEKHTENKMKICELCVIAKEKSTIFYCINLKNFYEYVIKKPIELLSQEKALEFMKIEVEINEKLYRNIKNSLEYRYIGFSIKNDKNCLVLAKGICDLEEFFMIYPEINKKLMLFITNAMLNAVKILHEKQIAHNDIKLKNFVFFKNVKNEIDLKIIDFGNTKLEMFYELQPNDFSKLLRILPQIANKYNRKSIFTQKIKKWLDFLNEITMKNPIKEIQIDNFFEFYEIFKISEEEILAFSGKLYRKYFSDDKIALKTMNSNISREDKLEFSDNLCLIGLFPKALQLNKNLETEFFEKKMWKNYLKTIENKENLLVSHYFAKLRKNKRKSLEIACFYEKAYEDSIEKLCEEFKRIYKESFQVFMQEIDSSLKIYKKLVEFLKNLKVLLMYFQAFSNDFEGNKEKFEKNIEEIRERVKEKIRMKKGKSKKHEEIYENFWEFLGIWVGEKKDLKEKFRRNLKRIIQKYIVFYDICE